MANENRWERDVKVGDTKVEVGGEYTLPDYLPEVKRLLRVDLAVFPDGQYLRDGVAECGGRVKYYVFYLAQDGRLSCATLDGEYTGEVPVEAGADVLVCARGEGATCRPLGPRKLALKANICLHSTAFVTESKEDEMPDEAGEVERLIKMLPVAHSYFVGSADIPLTHTLHQGGNFEVLSSDAHVIVRGAKCEDGGVRANGEVWVSCMLTSQDGAPRTQRIKIPFEEYVPTEDARTGDRIAVEGKVRELRATVAEIDDGYCLAVDATITLSGIGTREGMCEVLVDLYSLSHPTDVSTRQIRTRTYPVMCAGAYTVDGYEERGNMECRAADSVLDVRAEVVSASASPENGEMVVEGMVRACGIASGESGYVPFTMQFPYKVRIPMHVDETPSAMDCEANVECIGANAHFEGERISVSAELACSVIGRMESGATMVDEVRVGEETYEKDDCVRAVYLTDNDSLWSVAKRYHVPMSEVAEDNSLPEETLENPDASYLLDGLTRLVIR